MSTVQKVERMASLVAAPGSKPATGIELSGRKVLVFLKRYLGDAVMAEPLVSALAETGAQVSIVCPSAARDLLGHLHDRVSFIPFDDIDRAQLGVVLRQASRLREEKFDAALLVNRSFQTAAVVRLAGVPTRIGHGTEARSILLTRSVEFRSAEFEASAYADLARPAGFELQRQEPQLLVTEAERAEGLALGQGATVAVQPGARYRLRRIPTDTLAQLGHELQRRGHRIVLVGDAAESAAGDALAAQLEGPVVNLIGKTTIRQVLSVLAGVRALVAGDTGIMHCGAALGVPTLGVFGWTDDVRWAHRYPPHQTLKVPAAHPGHGKYWDLSALDPNVLIDATLRMLGEGRDDWHDGL